MEVLTYKNMQFYECCSAICIGVSLVKDLILLSFQTFLLDDNWAYTEFHTVVTCQKGSSVRYVFSVCSYPVKLRLHMILWTSHTHTKTNKKHPPEVNDSDFVHFHWVPLSGELESCRSSQLTSSYLAKLKIYQIVIYTNITMNATKNKNLLQIL